MYKSSIHINRLICNIADTEDTSSCYKKSVAFRISAADSKNNTNILYYYILITSCQTQPNRTDWVHKKQLKCILPQCTDYWLQLLIMYSHLDLLQMKSEHWTCITTYFFFSASYYAKDRNSLSERPINVWRKRERCVIAHAPTHSVFLK